MGTAWSYFFYCTISQSVAFPYSFPVQKDEVWWKNLNKQPKYIYRMFCETFQPSCSRRNNSIVAQKQRCGVGLKGWIHWIELIQLWSLRKSVDFSIRYLNIESMMQTLDHAIPGFIFCLLLSNEIEKYASVLMMIK